MSMIKRQRKPRPFDNAAFSTLQQQAEEHSLELRLVWEGRANDERTEGPNLRKFAVYHTAGTDRVLAGMVIVEGFGPEGIALWKLEETANPQASMKRLADWAFVKSRMADDKRAVVGRFTVSREEEAPDDDDGEPA